MPPGERAATFIAKSGKRIMYGIEVETSCSTV
jgi:hypothetical protein